MKIKLKISLLIIATLVLILSISTYYTQRIIEKDSEDALREEVIKVVRQIDLDIVTSGAITGPGELDENLKELMFIRSNIARIDIFSFADSSTLKPFYSKVGRQVALATLSPYDIEKVRQGKILLSFENVNKINYVNVTAPTHFNEIISGLVQVKISREEVDSLLSKQRKAAFLITIVAVVVTSWFLMLFINYIINNPVQRLLATISRIKEGDLTVLVTPVSRDEIGGLSENFNSMVETLRKNSEEREMLLRQINSHNEELQHKIRIATEELVNRNEELSNANQSIYRIQKQLGHSNRLAAVGQLSAMLAHEIGTPLHSISGHLQLLMEELDISGDKYRRLTIMQAQLERVINSIKNLLNTTRSHDTSIEPVDLNRLLEDIIILLMPETISRKITITNEFQADLPHIYGNSSQFQDIFLNLLDNAIDASHDGGDISVKTQLVNVPEGLNQPVEELARVDWIRVSITDNGRGIPDEQVTHIFEPFYTTKAHGQGTGLGLAITSEIINRYHGLIRVESKVNMGSEFTVFLPLLENR